MMINSWQVLILCQDKKIKQFNNAVNLLVHVPFNFSNTSYLQDILCILNTNFLF